MRKNKEIRTKGDISVSRSWYSDERKGLGMITIADLETKSRIAVFPHEIEFVIKALTELLALDSSDKVE